MIFRIDVVNNIVADEALLSRDALLAAVNARYTSQPVLARYVEYFDRLESRGIPVILSFRHFADVVGLPAAKLRAMAYATDRFYRSFHIPKRSGGLREISAPLPDLSTAQRWIAANILRVLANNPPSAVTAYTPGRSIITHVECHLSSAQLLKLDLRDFFPSISTERVCKLFFEAGYTAAVSRTLAAVTTVHGSLPQGAPSSPAISNLVLSAFDNAVSELCSRRELAYTRYADDIVISGARLGDIQDRVSSIAIESGFELNYKKSRAYTDPREPRFVTGLMIHEGRARLPKAARRRIRAQAHYYMRLLDRVLGEADTLQVPVLRDRHIADSFDDILFPDRLLGRLQFWSWIEVDATFPREAMFQLRDMLAKLPVD